MNNYNYADNSDVNQDNINLQSATKPLLAKKSLKESDKYNGVRSNSVMIPIEVKYMPLV